MKRKQVKSGKPSKGGSPRRRLVRANGRLVVQALPGEPRITSRKVRRLIEEMDAPSEVEGCGGDAVLDRMVP